MRQFSLPLLGQIKIGEDEPMRAVQKQTDVLGGLMEFTMNRLSNEKTISSKLLKANKEWVYRNNDVIAKEVAGLEFQLFSIGLSKGEITFKEIDDHPLLDILDRFNDATTCSDALYNTQSHKKLTGDAFWYVDRNGLIIRNIFILQPDKIEIELGDPNDATDSLIDGYLYKDVIDGKHIEQRYRPEEIIHFKTPNPSNPFRGYGAVEAAADTIDIDELTGETNRNFFKNGAIINFVLTSESKITDDQLKRLEAQLRANHGGAWNAFKTLILGGGLKPASLSMSNRDLEFLKMLEWYRDKLMVIFGNTKASLGIVDDVNRASHESSIISWKRNSIKPEMSAIVNTLNEFLVPLYGQNLILGFKDPVPEDRESKLKEVEVTSDILTKNERRELLGYDPIEGGDELPENAPPPVNQPKDPDQKLALPIGLKSVDVYKVLRQRKVFKLKAMNQELVSAAKPLARKLIQSRKRKGAETADIREHPVFTNEKVWEYWRKQINVVDTFEERFEGAVRQFIEYMEREAIAKLNDEYKANKAVKKQLLETEDLKVKAELDLAPLLMEEVIIAGQQALRLIDLDDPYIPFNIREAVRANIRKFAGSMIDTDLDKLAQIISDGVKNGESMAQVSDKIREAFIQFKKNQATLVARTEIIKVSNMASVDAWEQSGVVEAKQWLTAEDDRVDGKLCAPMNGRIIGLRDKFFRKGEEFNGHTFDYESIKQPPLHPGCRCVLLPVLDRAKAFIPASIDERAMMQKRIKELEEINDMRTKEAREAKKLRGDDQAYIKALEILAGKR